MTSASSLENSPRIQRSRPVSCVVGNGVFGGIEIVEVGELVAQGVADGAVGFADLVDALFADHDVVAVILGGDPEADDVRAVFFDVGLGGLRFFVAALALLALGNFFAVGIHHEAVSQDRFERGRAVAGQGEQQGGLEPAAMLVAAFEIHVGLPVHCGFRIADFGLRIALSGQGETPFSRDSIADWGEWQGRPGPDLAARRRCHFGWRNGAIPGAASRTAREEEPESIQTSRVSLDLVAASGPAQPDGLTRAHKFLGGFFKPNVGAVLGDQIGGVADDLGVENRLPLGVVKGGNGDAPGALARDAPVGPALDGGS